MAGSQPHLRVEHLRKHVISPDMHSLFLETEINFGGEGGLHAELVRNRDFEALGRGNLGDTGSALFTSIVTSLAARYPSPNHAHAYLSPRDAGNMCQ